MHQRSLRVARRHEPVCVTEQEEEEGGERGGGASGHKGCDYIRLLKSCVWG